MTAGKLVPPGSFNRSAFRRVGGALVCLLAMAFLPQTALCEDPVPESRVKAGFIYNFAKLTSWPEEALAPGTGDLNLWVLGQDPLNGELNKLDGRIAQGRTVRISYASTVEDVDGPCHIIYIGTGEEQLDQVLAFLADKPVLTVSDTAGFAMRGVMINLSTQEGRIQFEINPEAVRRSGVRISSHVMSLAILVDEER